MRPEIASVAPLLIVGASARAAAASALRAGRQPVAIDLFADRDLCAMGPALRIPVADYPAAIPERSRSFPVGPWMYTGALENHPDLVDQLAAERPLWGNPGAVLRQIRDPFLLHESLRAARLPAPRIRARACECDSTRSWLWKPRSSGGGLGIRPLTPGDPDSLPGFSLQERIDGPSGAALFVASKRGCELLGISRQWLADGSFLYQGSVGPWEPGAVATAQLRAAGDHLARHFGLAGLFGVDFLLNGDKAWVVEVNPRYTSSVEVHELATGRSLLAEHIRVFDQGAALPVEPGRARGVVGKAILFAPQALSFPAGSSGKPLRQPSGWPGFGDIPQVGEVIGPGEPVFTLYARGHDLASCESRLRRRLRGWQSRLLAGPDARRSLGLFG